MDLPPPRPAAEALPVFYTGQPPAVSRIRLPSALTACCCSVSPRGLTRSQPQSRVSGGSWQLILIVSSSTGSCDFASAAGSLGCPCLPAHPRQPPPPVDNLVARRSLWRCLLFPLQPVQTPDPNLSLAPRHCGHSSPEYPVWPRSRPVQSHPHPAAVAAGDRPVCTE
ncbi:hypothetical protein BO71DRAFT_5859 [Aspergillus ellipticus CBS 707.79]|uniref:Uncharacterized protein n=1 Tax=Aspergillus ellipticus CBS 707.79 TaxID=1448320 RepID=A0A319D7Q0_9EURO|nr:hypothetical protein BO71DRAFT_5859 [Aspergillus ellipticus CBS 707.79]